MVILRMKKKRKAKEEPENAFSMSKKTQRTPSKSERKDDDKLDQILKMMIEMKSDQKLIKEEIHRIRTEQEDFKSEIKRLTRENEELKEENVIIRKENKEIKDEIKQQRRFMNIYEKDRKKTNIVLSGLSMDMEDPGSLTKAIENIIKKYLELDIKVKNAKKIGNQTCLVELNNVDEKNEILQNKHKLKNNQLDRIYVNEDLTRDEMEKRKQLRNRAKEEANKGKSVKIGYNKIIVDGKEWRWNNKERKIEDPDETKN